MTAARGNIHPPLSRQILPDIFSEGKYASEFQTYFLTPVWHLQLRVLEKGMATHSGILACKFHGQRNLVGYSPWGHKESDMTERLITHASVLQKDLNLSVAQRTMFYESYGHYNKL